MTDKELLEAAAKAAGFGDPQEMKTCWTESEYPRNSGMYGALWNYVGHMDTAELWNPLTDDGDAFRLMCILNINISYRKNINGAWVLSEREGINFCPESLGDEWGTEETRRAIVRAAAEIGKATP